MQCVILAGGLAKRMRPLTEKIPKSLISLGDFPFLFYQLKWLRQTGVTEVVLSVGYKGELIREYVGDGSRWDLSVRFVDEGTELRGTAGALRLALEAGVLNQSFFVTYGDSFLPIDFNEVWQHFHQQDCPALMTVFKNQGRWDTSNVWLDGNRVALYDKFGAHPESASRLEFIDYGLSAFHRDVIEEWVPPGKADLAEVFHLLSRKGKLAGFEVVTRFYEIGSPEGLEDFRQWLKRDERFNRKES